MPAKEAKRSYKQEIIRKLNLLAAICIFSGVFFLCQPFTLTLYTIGFPIVLAGVILYNIVDHL